VASTRTLSVSIIQCILDTAMKLRMTRSGRKHQIGVAHVLTALQNAGEPVRDGDALRYVGVDDRGVELEIVIVPDDRHTDTWAIVHVMPTGFRRRL